MPRDMLTAILDDEAKGVHYFNGRILYAEDLREEQEAQRHRLERLGRPAGEGVAWGLEVELAGGGAPLPRTVTVRPGVAVSPKGQVLHLTEEVELAVAGEVAPPDREDARFDACVGETAVPDGLGPYVLLIGPASEYSERVPYIGIGDEGVSRGCGRRFVVDGVRFRLVHLDVEDGLPVPDPLSTPLRDLMIQATLSDAEESRLRNLLAHWCLGTGSHSAGFGRDLYDAIAGAHRGSLRYGPVDALRDKAEAAGRRRIDDCEVPLALLYWSGSGVRFVDMWAVRRRLHRSSAFAAPPLPGTDRTRAEGQAAFLQFQDHVRAVLGGTTSQVALDQIHARSHFRFLPAAGLLPERAGVRRGVSPLQFFAESPVRDPAFIDGARLPRILRRSFELGAVDLEQDELVWTYRVRQNRQPPASPGTVQAYFLFTSGHLGYEADPYYDLARWNYSNYGPGVGINTGD